MMLMEALEGFGDYVDYCFVGHSGDSAEVPLVDWGCAPPDRRARLAVLQRMAAHAQFCTSGDHTVEVIGTIFRGSKG